MTPIKIECPSCGQPIEIGESSPIAPPAPPSGFWRNVAIIAVAIIIATVVLWIMASTGIMALNSAKDAPGYSKPERAALAAQPITGAFGFTLGQKLADGIQVKDGEAFDEQRDTRVTISVLEDRTIYSIGALIINNYSSVELALKQKYGEGGFNYEGKAITYRWTNGTASLELRETGMTYTDSALKDRYYEQMRKEEAQKASAIAPHL